MTSGNLNIGFFNKTLVYLSIGSVLLFLYFNNYLTIPQIYSPELLSLSILCLFVGFLLDSYGWAFALNSGVFHTPYKLALKSCGLFVFSKYVPGKFWMILGRATYIANYQKADAKGLTALSVLTQLLSLFAAVILGVIGSFALRQTNSTLYLIGGLIVFLIAVFRFGITQRILTVLFRWLKRDFSLPRLSRKDYLVLLAIYFAFWSCWCLGFYCLAQSLTSVDLALPIGSAFASSSALGIAAIFAPGGIGVREGALVGYLNLSHLTLDNAFQIAAASRLWFLLGELFIFLVALSIKKPKG